MEFEEFDKKNKIEVDGFIENGKQYDIHPYIFQLL